MRTHVIKPLKYARAKTFTPIMNSLEFHKVFGGADGKSLPVDEHGLLRSIETIAFPHTKFELLESCGKTVYRVKTQAYPYGENLFVDVRFLEMADDQTPERPINLPPLSVVLSKMSSLLGTRYFWGGNCPGIPQMLEFYPPTSDVKSLEEKTLKDWTLQGLDCSGLLYYTTNGYTPRNTSSLISYGKSVPIEGISPANWNLKEGDLIVWKGHVLIVKDQNTVIESLLGHGVIESDLKKRLEQIMKDKTPVNNWDSSISTAQRFVVRRWHPDA